MLLNLQSSNGITIQQKFQKFKNKTITAAVFVSLIVNYVWDYGESEPLSMTFIEL